jgi:hypothetical protein
MKTGSVIMAFTLAALVSFGSVPHAYPMDTPCASGISKELKDKIIAMAERSKKEKKGLTLYLPGQSVSVIVTELIGTEAIIGKNREHDHVLIRIDRISGLAMN